MTYSALLVLEDGTHFKGTSIGISGITVGEAVFNTSMTGYQEIISDPSYTKQLITLTYPHIGNVGTNEEDNESHGVHCAGLIIRSLALSVSNHRSTSSLLEYLLKHKVVGISDIDTRHLTSLLREKGAMSACILAGDEFNSSQLDSEIQRAQLLAKSCPSLQGQDLAQGVTTNSIYEWTKPSVFVDSTLARSSFKKNHVVVYDFGVKHSILSRLVDVGCKVTVVPAKTPAMEVLQLKPDGIVLSNGPGDPEPCTYAIENAKVFMSHKIPLFGICLGHQILALACGAQTLKMKFGHHGGNHPVKSILDDRVLITSQNHGFAVDEKTLPSTLMVTHRSLFDGTLQGFTHKEIPLMSFQGHPEAGPGPNDVLGLFLQFVTMMG